MVELAAGDAFLGGLAVKAGAGDGQVELHGGGVEFHGGGLGERKAGEGGLAEVE